MADEKGNALILRPSSVIEKVGPKRLLSGIVSDALTVAKTQLASALNRIGEYEFRDPDYRQILIWAESLGMEPEDVVGELARCETDHYSDSISFQVRDGQLISLVWDFDQLPISEFQWQAPLVIERLGFKGGNTSDFCIQLPSLKTLLCHAISLDAFYPSQLPNLSVLSCSDNHLSELDLSMVPNLTELWCSNNQLTDLDLTHVPNLF